MMDWSSAFILIFHMSLLIGADKEGDDLVWNHFLQKYGDREGILDLGGMLKMPPVCSTSQNSSKCPNVTLHQNVTSWDDLRSSCPQLLYLMDNPSLCCLPQVTQNEHVDTRTTNTKKPTSGEVWGYGVLCVTLISSCSLAGVSVLPFMAKEFYGHLLTTMVGLAVGSLTGSAVFHLIPQAFNLIDSSSDPNHGYLNVSLVVCGGIWMFFMIERILKFILEYKDRKDKKRWTPEAIGVLAPDNSSHSVHALEHRSSHGGSQPSESPLNTIICAPTNAGMIYESQKQAIKSSFGHKDRPRTNSGHEHMVKFEQGKDSVIATVAWMIIFGDGLHNFIDGLSIGTAFNQNILTGVSISLAVLCEELPHELGDFAVLLNAGMTMKQALIYNFLSACTCYLGMAAGILLGEIEASIYIFALAGGMFLYIALVDMVPEMNEIAEEKAKVSVKGGLLVLGLQNLGLFMGITSLFVLAKYQDNIQL